MKKKFLYIIPTILGLFILFLGWQLTVKQDISIHPVSFKQLPGWQKSAAVTSLSAFQKSCKTFLKQDPEREVGSDLISIQVKDWQPACRVAMGMTSATPHQAQAFFQKWFSPVEFYNSQPVEGLFTGYYSPLLKGSLKKTDKYSVPLYALPSNLVTANLSEFNKDLKRERVIGRVAKGQLLPFHTRKEINHGAVNDTAKVIVWVDDPIDRQFLEIQGSGVVELENGERMYVGYAGENGGTYTPLARILIDKGEMTKDNASMQGIKRYLEAHPDEKQNILEQNKSFVFFRQLPDNEALGAQGIPLTPGYSLAVDRKWVPLGMPVWLNTTHPGVHSDSEHALQRLMIAQDTGGAIKGSVRGDVYWGAGKKATYVAGHMKNRGHYWLLLPKQVAQQFMNK